jgi:acetyltransferase
MSIRNLDALFRPASIALIGADAGAVGAVLARNLLAGGFDGPVMSVDPNAPSNGSSLAYASVAALPMAPELAVIAAAPATLPGLVAELGARGTRAAVVIGTGTAMEAPLRQAMLDAARPHLLRILGPDSLGLMAPHHGVNAGLAPVASLAGDLAFVSQSGAIAAAMLDWATHRGIGFSHVVALGDMADVDFGDMLDWLAADAHTRAILLYVETITEARKFMSAGRAAARTKPVVVIRPGRRETAPDAAGGLAGPDAVYDAAFRRAGMLRVFDLAELFDAVETLASGLRVEGERLAILTNGGGIGTLAAEALVDAGGTVVRLAPATATRLAALLPAGPDRGGGAVDLGDAASGDRFARALDALLADPGKDAVLVLNGPSAIADPAEAARAVIRSVAEAAKRDGRRPPVLTSWLGETAAAGSRRLFAEARIPGYATPGQAARAFMHLARHRRNQKLLMETPPALPEDFLPDPAAAAAVIATALADGRAELSGPEARSVLEAYRIPVAPAGSMPGPEAHPLVLGIGEDRLFGPILAFGQGGPAAGMLRDSAVALPPLNAVLARELMARARVWRLLQGYPGRPAADLDAIALTLVKLSQLAADLSEVAALEINPLLADAIGVVALDARIRVRPPLPAGTPRFAIRPYPQRLVRHFALRDGREITLRPVRPEDEPAIREMLQRSTPEDVRLRFFSTMRSFSHEFAARLTQIDYDREMALVAEAEEEDRRVLLGAVRIVADPDGETAEYGIMVRSDLKGVGLGHRLMTEIIGYARERGLRRIFGEVLRENVTMLRMAGEFGFAREDVPDEPGIVHVTISLDQLPALSQHPA